MALVVHSAGAAEHMPAGDLQRLRMALAAVRANPGAQGEWDSIDCALKQLEETLKKNTGAKAPELRGLGEGCIGRQGIRELLERLRKGGFVTASLPGHPWAVQPVLSQPSAPLQQLPMLGYAPTTSGVAPPSDVAARVIVVDTSDAAQQAPLTAHDLEHLGQQMLNKIEGAMQRTLESHDDSKTRLKDQLSNANGLIEAQQQEIDLMQRQLLDKDVEAEAAKRVAAEADRLRAEDNNPSALRKPVESYSHR